MASDGLRQLLERMGLQPIGRQEGFAALGSLMGSGLSGVTVARLDGRRFREIYELKSASGLLRDLNGPGSDPAEPGLGKADQDSQASATGIAAELAQLPMEEREEALLGRLRTPVASLLGYADPSALDGEANLFDLGMDSLMAMDLVAQIRERFAPEFSFLGMVNDASLRGIARLILQAQDPQAQPSAAAEEAVNLIEQAHLADDIQPPARSASPQSSKPRAILLTGATGFLGAYLLRDLLQQTDAQVFCLVRAKGALAARQRILTNLQRYGLWQEEFAERITPLPGDLSREKLGLEPAVYAELSERIDTVFQSAATLNFVYPYSRLRANNVQGTEEILRFACQGANKTLHYVSTDAVFDASHYYDRTVCEEEPIDHWQGIDLGYTQTKWVAERLVAMARERGLRANIYRPPLITGETGSGFWNTDDFTCLFLKGCIQLGCIPRIDARVTFVPVDYVSRAITALALDPDAQARNHHLTNPHGSTWQQVAAWIEASGHPLASIPYQQWEQRLLQGAERGDNVLAPLLPFFLKRWSDRAYTFAGLAEHRVRLDPTITLARLRGQGIDCPMVDEQLIRSYIRYFERCGFLSQTRAAA
jgi:thioester reductase-like protein